MSYNCKHKNRNYKSALQFYNATSQEIAATNTSADQLNVNLGGVVTDTGCAFDFSSSNIVVNASGLFRFSADASVTGSTGGSITLALAIDGVVVPETIRTVTVVASETQVVNFETIKVLKTCCNAAEHIVSIVAYSDGTAVASIPRISGNALKLA